MFRYNSKIVALLKDQIVKGNFRKDGYSPFYGEVRKMTIENNSKEEIPQIDSIKYQLLEDLIINARKQNIQLVMTISPSLGAISSKEYEPLRDLCLRNGIEVWDYYSDTLFQNPAYFSDSRHLNDRGAQLFTSVVASRLKTYLE